LVLLVVGSHDCVFLYRVSLANAKRLIEATSHNPTENRLHKSIQKHNNSLQRTVTRARFTHAAACR